MILGLHIGIAIISVLFTAVVCVWPSRPGLRTSYGLVGLTLATGTYLVASSPSHMARVCVTGLVYVGVMFAGIWLARTRLARAVRQA